MKKVMMERWNTEKLKQESSKRTMKTRSMTKKEKSKPKYTQDEIENGIIICMGGPYSERWFPPKN